MPVLAAGGVSRRKLPLNFREEDLPLFEDALESAIPETRLLELEDVGVSPDGMLFKAGGFC